MKNSIALWHPGVHRRVREQLYYFLVKIDGFFSSDFVDHFESKIVKQFGLASYCIYEIYGTFDILVRIWINPVDLRSFLQLLSRNVKAIAEFSVDQTLLHWCFPDLEDRLCSGLQDITTESILNIQKEKASDKDKFINNGLLVEIPPFSSKDSVKFFISVSSPIVPEQIAQDSLINEVKIILQNYKDITDQSMYKGNGCMWLLIKAATTNILKVRGLIDIISQKIEPYGSRTTTFICSTDKPLERDGIGMGAIAAMDSWDPAIDAWLPELYKELEPGSSLKIELEQFLRANLLSATLLEDDDIQLKNYFRAIVQQQKPMATAFGMELFSRMEALLRDSLGKFLSYNYGPQKVAETLVKFDKPREPKRMTLKELLGTYKRVFQDIDVSLVEELMPKRPDQIEQARNGLAHGWKNPIDTWKEIGEALFEIIVKGRKIMDYVEKKVNEQDRKNIL